jgi:hypothetical protein
MNIEAEKDFQELPSRMCSAPTDVAGNDDGR